MGDLAKTVELVQNSWKIVLGAVDAETAGVILFRHIFTIAPEAKGLFSFAKGKQSDEDLYNNLYLKKHGANVVMTVNTAVEGLTDLDALVPVLKGLGKRHVGYGVLPPHYDVVGQALIATLGDALGPQLTPEVKEAWLAVYGIVKDTMISDHYETKA
jgi:hemoglobin-like flavoprotein